MLLFCRVFLADVCYDPTVGYTQATLEGLQCQQCKHTPNKKKRHQDGTVPIWKTKMHKNHRHHELEKKDHQRSASACLTDLTSTLLPPPPPLLLLLLLHTHIPSGYHRLGSSGLLSPISSLLYCLCDECRLLLYWTPCPPPPQSCGYVPGTGRHGARCGSYHQCVNEELLYL